MSHRTLLRDYQRALRLALAKNEKLATDYDAYSALALVCREKLIDRWLETQQRYDEENPKRVYYLSLEFLMGRHLQNAVLNMDMEDEARSAMQSLGLVLEDMYEQEFDPGLGNGGLGRLAACFLDSMATLDIPAVGYGIRYEFGIFRQEIDNGYQVEHPDNWLVRGNPWEIARPEDMIPVRFYGRSECYRDQNGMERWRWVDADEVMALPYDTPVPGYGTRTVNTLRLWNSCASKEFDLEYFNSGDYLGAVARKSDSETLSKVLYPADEVPQGQELRLKQQYFFVAASLRDIIDRFLRHNDDLRNLPDKVAIQLNDTHPSIAVAELMRILLDEYVLGWDDAWEITQGTFAYTNHTLLPEALECWSVQLIGHLLPRHLDIIYEINRRFLEDVARRYPGNHGLLRDVSLIEEGPDKKVRMAHLAVVGSHSTNGVAALHTELLKQHVMPAFHRLFPGRFNNKTNGVTPRRWLKQANPALSLLISSRRGDDWVRDLDRLSELRPLACDAAFRDDWRAAKAANKAVLADYLLHHQGVRIDPESMFDVQVKRIHEYKRQLLNLLRIIADYLRIKEGVVSNPVPRTVMLGGKAAPAYHIAKLIIKLACSIAERINTDPDMAGKLRVVFLENYNVSLAERVIPAADLSEQISTAGYEASGTGNMKFSMNGALTIGTLDGANIEIAEAVGQENIFIFGLTADEVFNLKRTGYDPWQYIRRNALLAEVMQALQGGLFSPDDPGLFRPLYDALVFGDQYMLMADFASYLNAQEQVGSLYRKQDKWTEKAIINVAGMGRFSSDRAIREYAQDIWGVA